METEKPPAYLVPCPSPAQVSARHFVAFALLLFKTCLHQEGSAMRDTSRTVTRKTPILNQAW